MPFFFYRRNVNMIKFSRLLPKEIKKQKKKKKQKKNKKKKQTKIKQKKKTEI